MSLGQESDIHSPDWFFDEAAVIECASSLRQQMDTDFAAFFAATGRYRELSKRNGARFAEGVFARVVAEGLRLQGLYGPCIEAAEQATALLRSFPTSPEYFRSVRALAAGYAVSGNVDYGLSTSLDGFDSAIALGLYRDALLFSFDLCHWNREIGKYAEALQYLQYVSENLIDHCDSGLLDILYANYGEVYIEMGLVAEAEEVLKEGMKVGDTEVANYYMYLDGAMACVNAAKGEDEQARLLLKSAQTMSLQFADRRITAWLGYRLGKTYIANKSPEKSIEYLRDSIGFCESYDDQWFLVNLYEALTTAYETMGDVEAAYSALSKGHRILQDARSQNLSREAKALQQLNYNWKSRELELQNEISDALVKGKEAAERASQFKSMFLTKMSHELRTPLNGVLGVTKMLLNHDLQSDDRQLAQTIYASGQHILRLVNGVLDLSKIEAGSLPLNVQPFDLRQLVEEVIALYGPLCQEKGICLRTTFSDEVVAQVTGDRTRITQVITNLIGNASKFTTVGEINLVIDRTSREDDLQSVRFAVKDTGIGIPLEDQESIFEVFSQGGTAKFTGGAGLGLFISRELVTLMDGKIGLKSEVGLGSEFWFEIPLPVAEADSPVVDEVLEASQTELQHSLAGTKILVAEDDEVNWMVLESMLESVGAHACRANNGLEAVELFKGSKFDLVILDCHMDVMDGFEAACTIRRLETSGHIPILALSADVLEANIQRCLASGMDAFVGKPVQLGELIAKFAEVAPVLGVMI